MMLKILYILLFIPCIAFSQEFYDRLNIYRENNNKTEIKRDTTLEQQCYKWLLKSKGVQHDPAVDHAEVMAEGYTDPLYAWVYSPGHNAVLLGKYKYAGYYKLGDRACARFKE